MSTSSFEVLELHASSDDEPDQPPTSSETLTAGPIETNSQAQTVTTQNKPEWTKKSEPRDTSSLSGLVLPVKLDLCWRCGYPGHRRQTCIDRPLLFCSRCGTVGQMSRDCPCDSQSTKKEKTERGPIRKPTMPGIRPTRATKEILSQDESRRASRSRSVSRPHRTHSHRQHRSKTTVGTQTYFHPVILQKHVGVQTDGNDEAEFQSTKSRRYTLTRGFSQGRLIPTRYVGQVHRPTPEFSIPEAWKAPSRK